MSKFKSDDIQSGGVGKYPPFCGRTGCDGHTDVAIAVVMDGRGKYLSGPISSFGGNKENGYAISDKYQFIEWVTRCSFHYSEDTTIARGVDYAPITVPSGEMTKEQVEEARQHFVSMAKKFIKGSGVKRNKKNIKSGKWTNEMEARFKQRAATIGIEIL